MSMIVRSTNLPHNGAAAALFVMGGVISDWVGETVVTEDGPLAVPTEALPMLVVTFIIELLTSLLLELDVAEVEVSASIDEVEEVYVSGLPTAVAGIADPTPMLVNGVGKARLEVLGSAPEYPS